MPGTDLIYSQRNTAYAPPGTAETAIANILPAHAAAGGRPDLQWSTREA
ncbi:hypothetical protein [Arthrobacter monumenti]